MRLRWAWLAGFVAGCAGGGSAPGPVDTDTDATTSFGPTTFEEESSSETSSGNADEDSTGIGSQTGDGTSSGSTGSTGCTPGMLGCTCVDELCDEGLDCIDEVCAEPLCAAKEYEINDVFNEAWDLGEYDDSDPEQTFSSALSGTEDIDWYTYSCLDTTFDELVPVLSMQTAMPMRACLYIDCVVGGNPLFDCPAGTTPEQAPLDFIPGCCVDDASTIAFPDYNCPEPGGNDSVIVYIKAEMGASQTCIDYEMTYTC